MSYTWDEAHCLGFLDTLVVDLLLLTAESQGQLGLTQTNPLGHLEMPRCTAHQDYPTPSCTQCCAHTKSHWGHSLFSPVFFTSLATALILQTVRDESNSLAAGLHDLESCNFASWLCPFVFGSALEGRRRAPGSARGGGLIDQRTHLLSPSDD